MPRETSNLAQLGGEPWSSGASSKRAITPSSQLSGDRAFRMARRHAANSSLRVESVCSPFGPSGKGRERSASAEETAAAAQRRVSPSSKFRTWSM
jgi:hypothetical protein